MAFFWKKFTYMHHLLNVCYWAVYCHFIDLFFTFWYNCAFSLQHFIKKLQISPDDKTRIFINIEVCSSWHCNDLVLSVALIRQIGHCLVVCQSSMIIIDHWSKWFSNRLKKMFNWLFCGKKQNFLRSNKHNSIK